MEQLSVVSLFCDDIREEKRGTEILVGIMPDNINVPAIPFSFPKIAIYTRIHLNPEYNPGEMSITVRSASGADLFSAILDKDVIQKAINEATAKGSPIAGLINRTVSAGWAINEEGRITVVIRAGGKEYLSGFLNVKRTPS